MVAQARKSVVKVTAGDAQLSGVVLANPAGYVLTTSVSLSAGPVVTVTTDGGQTFQGWIVGRDDATDLTLVRVTGAALPGVSFGDSSTAALGTAVISIAYPVSRPGSAVPVEGAVMAVRTDFATGARFLRLDVPPIAGTVGGAVFNSRGELLAMAVESSYVQSLGLPAATGETFAKAEDTIQPAIAGLLSGKVNLTLARPMPAADSSAPPPFPVFFNGTASANGVALKAGSKIYARLFGSGLLDVWFIADVKSSGTYNMTVGVLNPRYVNSPIEFYVDGIKSGTVSKFAPVVDPATNIATTEFTINLTFP